MKWILAILCLACAAFCVYGFLATFEPVANALAFRLSYVALGAMCMAGALFNLLPAR